MVSSTVGSPTMTGWKRRSSAASFSMCLRYSSSVVAPMVCSSPRASIGFSMFEASSEPSAAPAPTTVWSSSMKRMNLPSASTISFSTALRRSSNSPRYFAPATRAPMSSAMIRLSFRPSGTSPRTIRWARPSTIAVLPTPGSPISTGLFLVRRDRTWMTRRTSSSRPITGSSLPLRASSVRSRPYFSSAWYLFSGFGSVTRWLPRTLVSASRIRSRVMPTLLQRRRRRGRGRVSAARPEQQVLGADVVVLHLLGVGRGGVDDHAQARRQVRLGRRPTSWAACRACRAARAPSASGSTDSLRSTAGTTPSGCSSSVTSRCSGSTDAWPNSRASSGVARMACWAFSVNFCRFMTLVLPSAFCPCACSTRGQLLVEALRVGVVRACAAGPRPRRRRGRPAVPFSPRAGSPRPRRRSF